MPSEEDDTERRPEEKLAGDAQQEDDEKSLAQRELNDNTKNSTSQFIQKETSDEAGPHSPLWEEAYDEASRRPYWFCRDLGLSQWTPPPQWTAAVTNSQHQQSEGKSEASETGGDSGGGFHYVDAEGQVQGPYEWSQLQAWRSHLPMDLPVWRSGEESQWLATVLGDEHLLQSWWTQHPELTGTPNSAPPATALSGQDSVLEAQRESVRTSKTDEEPGGYAEAVLAGLPPSDDALQVAQMAASTGKPLSEVLDWSREGEAYTVIAHRSRAGGLTTSRDQDSLYGELASWADPSKVAEQLAKAAAARKRVLTREEVSEMKRAKHEVRRSRQNAWLYSK